MLFSHNLVKITQLGGKQLNCWLPHEVDNRYSDIDCSPGCVIPWIWWKECSWTLKRLKNSLNWQETGKFEEKRAGRRMESSPILGYPPNSYLTRGRQSQSSAVWAGKPPVGDTGPYWPGGYGLSSCGLRSPRVWLTSLWWASSARIANTISRILASGCKVKKWKIGQNK